MKRWMIGLAIAILLSSLGCQAQDNNGLFYYGNLHCEQMETPEISGSDVKLATAEGVYDLEVAKYIGGSAGYFVKAWLGNERMPSQKDNLSRGEGNIIRIKGFEVKYEALGFEIEKLFVPVNMPIKPQESLAVTINTMPEAVRTKVLEYWAKAAYKDVENATTYFHVDAQGATAKCTPFTANDDCNGYACNIADGGSFSSTGRCMPMCTREIGCALNCYEQTVTGDDGKPTVENVCETANWCDTGTGDIGFCRPTCIDSGYCPPVTLPDGTVVLEFDCISGRCIPKGTKVNPFAGENIIVKMKALAENSNGDDFTSNTFVFNIKVCRGCLLSYKGTYCSSKTSDIIEALKKENYSCQTKYWGQDIGVDCSMLGGCSNFFCK